MKNGDISAEQFPRALFVWENCLAILPDKDRARERRALGRHRWGRALSYWGVDPMMRRKLVDMSWRQHIPVDILTTHHVGYKDCLAKWLDDTNYPHNRLIHEPAGLIAFSDHLFEFPEVGVVYHSEAGQPFLFGSKGLCVVGVGSVQ